MSRAEQDRIFKRNAHIRQKIYGVLFDLFCIGFWAWCMAYDPVNIYHIVLVLPLVLMGLHFATTKRNYAWEWMKGEKGWQK